MTTARNTINRLLPRSHRRSAFAAVAATGALALSLTACSTGGKDAAAGDGGDQQKQAEQAAPAFQQLNAEDLTTVINSVEVDGQKFEAHDSNPDEVAGFVEQLKQADVEPQECKDLIVGLAGAPEADSPMAFGLTGDNAYSTSVVSYETEDTAATALKTGKEATSTCKNMKMSVGGQTIEFSAEVSDIDVPGTDEAIVTKMSTPAAAGMDNYTVSARSGNGIITGTKMHGSEQAASAEVAEKVAAAYTEAAKG